MVRHSVRLCKNCTFGAPIASLTSTGALQTGLKLKDERRQMSELCSSTSNLIPAARKPPLWEVKPSSCCSSRQVGLMLKLLLMQPAVCLALCVTTAISLRRRGWRLVSVHLFKSKASFYARSRPCVTRLVCRAPLQHSSPHLVVLRSWNGIVWHLSQAFISQY